MTIPEQRYVVSRTGEIEVFICNVAPRAATHDLENDNREPRELLDTKTDNSKTFSLHSFIFRSGIKQNLEKRLKAEERLSQLCQDM